MDRYYENEKRLAALREQIVKDIRETLEEKGYREGDSVFYCRHRFEILSDRLLVNDYHTDSISVDELMEALRTAMHVWPKA